MSLVKWLTFGFVTFESARLPVPVTARFCRISGKVIRISGGDTMVLMDQDKVTHKVRLNGIKAPKSNQAFGSKSRHHLGGLIHEKNVRVEWTKKDRYGRILGDVFCDDKPINLLMLRDGMAWHFKRFDCRKTLADMEREARDAGRGLWVDKVPESQGEGDSPIMCPLDL